MFHWGAKGVHVFFIISGMVIPLSMLRGHYRYQSFKVFLYKRVTRIEPPYLAAMAIGLCYLYIRKFVPGSAPMEDFTLKEIGLHLGYLIPFVEDTRWINQGFWTLAIEFQYYLFLALAFPLVHHRIGRWVFYALMILPSIWIPSNAFLMGWSAYFLIGLSYILFREKKISGKEFVGVQLLTALGVLSALRPEDLIIAWLTLGAVHVFTRWENRITLYLGNISYSLYLLHSVIGAAVINFLSHRYTASWQKPLVIGLGVACTLVACHYFYRWVEKPSQQWSKKWKYVS